MRRTLAGVVVSLVLFCGLGGAQAEGITFTFDGTGSGTLDGSAFSDEEFTITVIADTLDVVSCGSGVVSVDSLSADIFISGFEGATFSIPTRVFDNSFGVLGFSQGSCQGADLLDIRDDAFRTYDLTTSIGPILVAQPFALEQFANIPTTGGILTMGSARDITFNAATESGTAPQVPKRSSSFVFDSGLRGIVSGVPR